MIMVVTLIGNSPPDFFEECGSPTLDGRPSEGCTTARDVGIGSVARRLPQAQQTPEPARVCQQQGPWSPNGKSLNLGVFTARYDDDRAKGSDPITWRSVGSLLSVRLLC